MGSGGAKIFLGKASVTASNLNTAKIIFCQLVIVNKKLSLEICCENDIDIIFFLNIGFSSNLREQMQARILLHGLAQDPVLTL